MRSAAFPKTKVRPPVLHRPVIARPRLTAAFRDRCALTVICAPAGSGKTTLAREWFVPDKTQVAWLSLDVDDNDPIRFVRGMVAAFQTAGIKLRMNPGQRDLTLLMTDMINGLEDGDSLTLVLDDYHVISSEHVHAAIGYLLDHLPGSLALVLVSRQEPPLALARLRVRGQLREIHLQDLRFTTEEAQAFFSQVMGLDLSTEQVRMLEQRTQGWIAGLQMAALSLQANRHSSLPYVPEQQFVNDYLLTEVFYQQTPEVQNFLLQTSIFDRFSLPLCKTLVTSNAGKLLAQVQRANLFISMVDAWYQYHPLFREFLRTHLYDHFAEQAHDLHRRASLWFEQNDMVPEAIQHAFDSTDHATAARLIAFVAPEYLKRGELVSLQRWLERLPESVIWDQPRLCLTQIWILLDSNLHTDARHYFDRLGNFLENNLRGEFLAVRALYAAMSHEPEAALGFAERAQKTAEAKDPFIQTYVSFGLGAAQKMGLHLFQAEQSFRDCLSLADTDGNSYLAIASLVHLADVLYLQGRLFDAETVCQRALRRFGEGLPDARNWYWTLARVCYQRHELERALSFIESAIELSETTQETTVHSRALLQRALIRQAQGRKDLALADLDAADQLARGLQEQHIIRQVIRQRVLFALERGDLPSALQWLDVFTGYGDQPFPFYDSYTKGRVLLATGNQADAHVQFASALERLEDVDYVLARVEILVWQAICLASLGNTTEAARVLKRAIDAAQTEKLVRPFLDAQSELRPLVDRLGRGEFGWIAEQLAEHRQRAKAPALTRREREILELLVLGLSNQQMAEKLVIAPGTLKRHIANLYLKLGVHNRAQAVRYYHQQ